MKNSQNPAQGNSQALIQMIQESALLDPDKGLVFDLNLQRMKCYVEDPSFQIFHSKALLKRMKLSTDLHELQNLSERQADMPHFGHSAQLQELYAQGMILLAQKDSATDIHEDALKRLFDLPHFNRSAQIQRVAAALLLESIANCKSPRKARELERKFWEIPKADTDPEIRKMAALSQELTEKTGRQSAVKIDLRHKVPGLLRALSRFVGMGDYRMRVWLGGSPRYKHMIVKVAARDEQSAKATVQEFMDDFLAQDSEATREIVDVFPPGSMWESGPYPVLKV